MTQTLISKELILMMNKLITLKSGETGRVIAQLHTGEYVLEVNKGNLIKFNREDMEVEDNDRRALRT